MFHSFRLVSVRLTGVRTMKYEVPPVRCTPVIAVMETKPQQVPKTVLVVRLFQSAPDTRAPREPLTSVQMLASKVWGLGV
jgi:hypothetical protein